MRASAAASLFPGVAMLAALAGCAAEPPGEDGSGSLTLTPQSAPIRSAQSWTLVYRAGEAGVRSGGALLLRVWPEWGWDSPQLGRPDAPGYLSWHSDADVVLEASIRRAPQSKLDSVVLRLVEGALHNGDRVEIRYESRAGPFAGTSRQLHIEVDGDGDGSFLPVAEVPRLTALPGAAGSLWVVARVPAPGSGAALAQASVLDRWDNVLRTREVRGEGPFVRATDPESGLEGRSGRVWPTAWAGQRRLFWGDLHGHSAWSDGTGQPDAYYRYARDVAALDFAALTDHDIIGPSTLDVERWRGLRDVAEAFDEPGRFATLIGYEYTNWESGHLTILSPSRELPVFSAGDPATKNVEDLMARLARLSVPVLAIPHHPGGSSMPFDWDRFDPRFMTLVEIFSIHGSSECYECPLRLQRPREGSFVRDALLRGHRMAFIGSGDTHNGHPGRRTRREPRRTGLVGVWAEELSREAIWEALAAGRTFATTGSRTQARLDFDGTAFRVGVRAASRVASVEIVKRGAVVFRAESAAPSLDLEWVDSEPPRPGDFYYLRVTETDGHMAWTSPIYRP